MRDLKIYTLRFNDIKVPWEEPHPSVIKKEDIRGFIPKTVQPVDVIQYIHKDSRISRFVGSGGDNWLNLSNVRLIEQNDEYSKLMDKVDELYNS